MKAKYIILISFATLMCIHACQDDWLEPKPLSIYVPENVFVNEDGMEAILLVLRRGLRDEFYGNASMLCQEISASDIAHKNGEQAIEIHDFNTQFTPTSGGRDADQYHRYWTHAYNMIRDVNVLLNRVDGIESSTEKKNEFIAEGYFHRAYWYYRLVHYWGDVPFINIEHQAPRVDFNSHSRNTILDKIQEDLEFSVQWLPISVAPGKVNRAAAQHLLTKIYLSNHEYKKAISSASDVIDGGQYSLMTDRFGSEAGDDRFNVVWDLHRVENKSISANTEGILVVQDRFGFPGAQSPGTNTMRNLVPFWAHGSYIMDPDGSPGMLSRPFDPQIWAWGRGVGYTRGSNYHQYYIWQNYGDDLRRCADTNWMTVEKMRYNNPASNYFGEFVQPEYTAPYDTGRALYDWPHYKLHVPNEPTVGNWAGGHGDWYVFRLAETYLLRAEAYYWDGDFENAANDINQVRERALATPINASDVTMDYILDERARELYYEEPRNAELTRISFMKAETGRRGYSMDNFHESSYWFDRIEELHGFYNTGFQYGPNISRISAYHVLWPVRQSFIDANTGGRINQNRGYPGYENNIPPLTEITDEQ